MTNFIQIKEVRLHKNSIKRYQPVEERSLAIYFTASRSVRIDREIFKFNSRQERDEIVGTLDAML